MKNQEQKEWYRILDSLRNTYGADPTAPLPFTIDKLVSSGLVTAGPHSSAREMVSGYLSTLRKWGYIRRHERLEQTGPGRPSYSYVVTEFGFKAKVLPSPHEDLQSILKAIADLKDAEGEKEEQKALKKLLQLYDEIVDARSPEASE